MKTIIPSARYFFMLLSFAALLTACAAKPTSVARKYFAALEVRDYEEAREYVAPASITNFNKLFNYGKEPAKQYTIVRFEETGEDRAKVYYTEDGSTNEQYVELVKIDGEWKILIRDADDFDK